MFPWVWMESQPIDDQESVSESLLRDGLQFTSFNLLNPWKPTSVQYLFPIAGLIWRRRGWRDGMQVLFHRLAVIYRIWTLRGPCSGGGEGARFVYACNFTCPQTHIPVISIWTPCQSNAIFHQTVFSSAGRRARKGWRRRHPHGYEAGCCYGNQKRLQFSIFPAEERRGAGARGGGRRRESRSGAQDNQYPHTARPARSPDHPFTPDHPSTPDRPSTTSQSEKCSW